MFDKILDVWSDFGTAVSEKYRAVSNRWLILILLPIYIVFAVLYTLVILLILGVFSIKCKLEGSLTFTEFFNAFKEGVEEGLYELKG